MIEQSHKEKLEMYMKLTKRELAEMLIEANKQLTLALGSNPGFKIPEPEECAHEWYTCGSPNVLCCRKCGTTKIEIEDHSTISGGIDLCGWGIYSDNVYIND